MATVAEPKKPNLYTYHDYLLFIKDWVHYKQSTDRKFSLRQWSQNIAASPSLVTMILKNEREISESLFYRMIQQMELKKSERDTLTLLRKIATSLHSQERVEAYHQLIKIPEYKKENLENLKAYEYLSNWLHIAIRELAFTPDFRDDPAWIRSRLRIDTERKEIERTLEFLKTNGYLICDENKKWKPHNQLLNCSEGVYKLSLSEIHRKMLDLASRAIEEVPRTNRFIAGHTFSVAKHQYQEARKILEDALLKIQNLDQKYLLENSPNAKKQIQMQGSTTLADTPSLKKCDVYHMELVLFPLTQLTEESTNE